MNWYIANGVFWGVFSTTLGFMVTNSWQAWAIIIAGNLAFHLGATKG